MQISTKGRYSIRMLLDLAEHKDEGFISLKEIADRQGISKKYLEQLVTLLHQSDILRTNRGYQGGYMLAKAPGQYTIGQILRITEGGLCPVACLKDDPIQCERSGHCQTLPVWKELQRITNEYLDSVTLQTILDNKKDAAGNEYSI
ncbi:MAG: Rrf2 family transcriptional regulator [Spirochaetota bacterium]|jgi:Rrf2 family protein|nr:Rrf2 family transcriptional regulator [Spirochaetota bacterium]